MEGVKNLVVKKHNLPVTKIVEELMEVSFHDLRSTLGGTLTRRCQLHPWRSD
jgi:hypothetical protein